MIYHVKKNMKRRNHPPIRNNVLLIMFLSKILSEAETRYWSTEFKMTAFVWTVRKLRLMIFSSDHPTVIYTNHGASPGIVFQIKLAFSNTNKLNMKLIRASIYFSQFRLKIHHRTDCFNLVPDALSRLFIKNTRADSSDGLNVDSYFIKDTADTVYAFNQAVMTMNDEFRIKIIEDYQEDKTYKKLLPTLRKLAASIKKKSTSDRPVHTKMNFVLRDGLIYHVRDDKKRLCISASMKKMMLKAAHDDCNHAKHHRAYARLSETVYIHKLSKKLTIYIRHCSACQLNQTRRHRQYEELMPIITSFIPFHTIVMDFVLDLPITNPIDYDCVLNVTNKFFKRMLCISDKSTWTATKWADKVLDRLLKADWEISAAIISDKNSKFLFTFWITMLRKLGVVMLFSAAYHPQTNDLSEKMNQIFEIALRYVIAVNSDVDWKKILPALQMSFNNSSNAITSRSSNEVCYGFKVREVIHVAIDVKAKNLDKNTQAQLNELNETRFCYRQKAADAISYVGIASKIWYDSMHVLLLLRPKNKAFLRLHHEYFLPGKHNRKLFNQRTGPFLVKRRVECLAYELELSPRWRVHPVISVTQLKSESEGVDPYNKFRPNHSEEVEVEDILNTPWLKSYEIEKLVDRRIRSYGKRQITQYLLRWKGYEFEYDEWKSFTALSNFMNFVKNYERIYPAGFSPTERTSRKLRDKKLKIIVFTINSSSAENNDDKINVKSQILVQISSGAFQFAKIVAEDRADDFAFPVSNINAMSLKRGRGRFKKDIKL